MIIIVFVLIEKSYFWAVIAAFLDKLKPITIFYILEVPVFFWHILFKVFVHHLWSNEIWIFENKIILSNLFWNKTKKYES